MCRCNFITDIDPAKHPEWPEGLVKIGFSGLKQKLFGAIAVIAAVNVLEWFMDIERQADNIKLAWVVGILLAFAVSLGPLSRRTRLPGRALMLPLDPGERHARLRSYG